MQRTDDATRRFLTDVRNRLRAGFAILWVVTHDEMRALRMLSGALTDHKLQVWTSTRGLAGGDASLSEPVVMLSAAAEPGRHVWWALLDLHPFLGDPAVVRSLRDFVVAASKGGKALVVVSPVADIPVELERDVAVLSLPLPSSDELHAWWRQQLAHEKNEVAARTDDKAIVRAAEGLNEGEARRAFRAATAPGVRDPVASVWSQKRAALGRSGALRMIDDDTTLDDIGGLRVLKGWMTARAGAFGDEARKFGLPEPRGVMVCGVQGCGKSLVAKVAARVFGMPLVRLDFAQVFGSPSPELTMRRAIETAEAVAPVVLWIDEIEKGLGAAASSSGVLRVFGDFLIWMQEKRSTVFVAATANEVEQIPPELVRRGRFDEVFFVDLPGKDERREILGIHLRRRGRNPDEFDLDELVNATESFSGAELEQVIIAGLFHAFSRGRLLQDGDLQLASRETVPLATMYEDQVQQLRQWADTHARRASARTRTLDLFRQ